MQAKRWAEHFTEVLNTEAPTITADPPAPNDDLDIATGVPTLQDVTHAINQMKTGKSPGIGNICIELLKTDVITVENVFTDLFNDVWTTNEIPRDWNKGLFVKNTKERRPSKLLQLERNNIVINAEHDFLQSLT